MNYVNTLGAISDKNDMNKILEAEKKRFAGFELKGKKLGVVGLGAIGSMVAEVGLALGMDVAGYDPAISIEAAWRMSNQVQRKENIQSLLAHADYLTLHVPALDSTKNMINADTLKLMKKGAVILNFARDAIVDAKAVVASLEAGHLGAYVCDFPEPCLIGKPGVIAMPHIGASTEEAEDNCAVMAANQLMDYLENNVAGVLGDVLSVLAAHQVNVIDMTNRSRGDVAYNIIDVEGAPPASAIEGIAKVNNVIAVRVIR
jgi:D-3-phosphoglycerate dehydrogenase / 2-oxoglutarate reductase